MTMSPTLVLASASPARLHTLRAAGLDPHVVVSGVDESLVTSDCPQTLCATLARLKAEAVAGRLRQEPGTGPTLVLGCDSVLEIGDQTLGKPADPAEAIRRWHRMRGSSGVLHTGHFLVSVADGRHGAEVSSTTVHFADVSDRDVAAYVASEEPLRVAGGFTIDGLGGWFVERLDGDHGTVIGLSLPVLRRLLAGFGVAVADLWELGAASSTPEGTASAAPPATANAQSRKVNT